MKNKIYLLGSDNFSLCILNNLKQSKKFKLIGIGIKEYNTINKHKKINPIIHWGKLNNIKIDILNSNNCCNQILTRMKSLMPNILLIASFGQILNKNILELQHIKIINVHASLLPKYRGGSPMHRAIQNGDSKTGITIMYMRKKMDSGEILAQEEVNITESDTVGTLEEKLSIVGRDLLIKTLKELPNIIPKTQDESQVTYAYNIKPIEEHIDFSQTAKQIYNHVRAFNPWPLTYFLIDGLKVKLYSVKYIDKNISSNIGEIVEVKKDGFSIQTKNGLIQPKVLQLQGKKKMDVLSFMNGTGRTLFVKGKMVE